MDRKEYSKEYYKKKKREKTEKQIENIKRKTSGKAQKLASSFFLDEDNCKDFSSLKEETTIIFNPGKDSTPFVFRKKGLNLFNEFFAKVHYSFEFKKAKVFLILKMQIHDGKHFELVSPYWEKDVTNDLKILNTSNYYKILSEYTSKICSRVEKMNTLDFLESIIGYCTKKNSDIVFFLWDCLDAEYVKQKQITLKKLEEMIGKSTNI